ncbi:hypothetical protein [uncultured Traorella sp.]|uniref:RNA polymerase factor sigma-54 n=1 Tax=uncultured Traorella sp. TaxID=1929048 RepID=UPI0025F96F96|nr:hypothetical protein [uncultured Traorella sp.]
MNYRLNKQLKTIQTQTFHAKLYDSLEFLRISNSEMFQSILQLIQENPLLEIEPISYPYLSLDESFENVSKQVDLKAHLYFQLHTTDSSYDSRVCSYIIESLNDSGFFNDDFESVCQKLNVQIDVFKKNLNLIQHFDPIGVAAKDSIDALIIQCKNQHRYHAATMLQCYHEEIIQQNYVSIAKNMHRTLNDIKQDMAFIRTLNPYPCSVFSSEKNEFILPDLKVEIIDHQIVLSPIRYFQISTNDLYTDLIDHDPTVRKYFQDAKILLANLDKRNSTLMLVASELLKIQENYFLYGSELEPCTQQNIASQLGINASTVSRAIADKYYEFNHHYFRLSDLFVSSTTQGDSSDAIKKAMIEIIEDEDKRAPFNDDQLVRELKKYNLNVSRRTVNKYRTLLNIQKASKRRIK